jgi:PKD repeat protein
VADPNGPYTANLGSSITFDGSGSYDPDGGPIVAYNWDFGDSSSGTGVTPTHTYSALGTYTVTLTVTDEFGLTDSASATTDIVPVPTIESCDVVGYKKDTFNFNDLVYVRGDDFQAFESYDLYVVEDATWIDAMTIPDRVSGTPTSVSSLGEGIILPTSLGYLDVGKYDILVDFNGDGTFNEGIDVLDDSDVEVTASFSVTASTSVESCDAATNTKDTFDMSDNAYIIGAGYSPMGTYNLYVVSDVSVWTDGMAIPSRVSGSESTVMANSLGAILGALAWNGPLTYGKYDIVVDFDGDGIYDEGLDAIDDSDVEVTAGLFVIPERARDGDRMWWNS